jgi:aminoglycoside phosphotransferase (APT) family kinase protein
MLQGSSKKRDRYTVGVERCGEDRVAKFFGPDVITEYEKAQAMELALAGTPFLVPRTLGCDVKTGRIDSEYLAETILLQEVVEQAQHRREYRPLMKLNDDAARLLGTLHQRLVLVKARRWQPPVFLVERARRLGCQLDRANDVFLHCDYSPVNLLVGPEGRIAVIDASPNSYFTDYASLTGPPLVDIATYTVKLCWPFRTSAYSPFWRKVAARLRERFVREYERSSGRSVDRELLGAFEYAVLRGFVEWKSQSRLVRSAAMMLARVALLRSYTR